MRLRKWTKILIFLPLNILSLIGAFTIDDAFCAESKKGVKSSFSHDLEVGARAMFQYQLYQSIITPPPMAGGEVSASIWFKEQAAIYVFYDHSIGLAPFWAMGGGIKVPFLGFSNGRSSVFSEPHVFFVLDWMQYSLSSIPAGKVYPDSGSVLRWGFAIRINFGQSGLYLNTEVMGTRWNDNLMLAPLLGIGVHF